MNQSGLLTCASYAFPPNTLHYCGPEEQVNLHAYLQEKLIDQGLTEIIKDFQTLYPYLYLIAKENNIRDPFDKRVVDAYWIGNNLLYNVSMQSFYRHFNDALGLKKKLKKTEIDLIMGKLPNGLLPHHTFHVLNIFNRTGHHAIEHTLETMDNCRIGWGTIIDKVEHKIKSTPINIRVKTKPLLLENDKLILGEPIIKTIKMAGNYIQNSIITFHWNTVCEVISMEKACQLEYYTQKAILLANKTI